MIEWATNVRAIACLMVVALHVTAYYVGRLDAAIHPDAWMTGNIIDAFLRTCVPLFFMLSGFLFAGEKRPEPRHIWKLLRILCFYSIPGILIFVFVKDREWLNVLEKLPYAPAFPHLWFFYALIPVYLLWMLVSIRISPHAIRGWHVGVCILAMILVSPERRQLIEVFTGAYSESYTRDTSGNFSFYLLYGVLGYLLGNIAISGHSWKPRLAGGLLFIAPSAAIAWFTGHITQHTGAFDGRFYTYHSPFVVLAAAGIFLFLRTLHAPSGPARWIAGHSLTIYAVHHYLLYGLAYHVEYWRSDAWWMGVLVFLEILILSVLLAMGIKAADRKKWLT